LRAPIQTLSETQIPAPGSLQSADCYSVSPGVGHEQFLSNLVFLFFLLKYASIQQGFESNFERKPVYNACIGQSAISDVSEQFYVWLTSGGYRVREGLAKNM